MRRFGWWVFVTLTLASPPAAAGTASPAGTKTFAGWTGTCDNIGDCVALATASDDLFYVRIARGAAVTAPPEVKLVLVASSPLAGATPAFRLGVVTDRKTAPLGLFATTSIDGDPSAIASTIPAGEPGLAFIDAVRNGTRLDYAAADVKGSLDLKGLAAVLRWIDVRQGRAGTPTALVARGMTPIGQVPGPREMPIVRAAPAGSVTAVAKPVLSQALLRRALAIEDCDADVVKAHVSAEAWQVGRDRILISLPCIQGAYNATSALYFTDGTGGTPRPVPLPRAPGGEVATAENVVTNMRFDPKTMILSEFGKGRGIGDCGETRTFVWTGQIFALVEATALDACPGALQADWPRVYQAQRE